VGYYRYLSDETICQETEDSGQRNWGRCPSIRSAVRELRCRQSSWSMSKQLPSLRIYDASLYAFTIVNQLARLSFFGDGRGNVVLLCCQQFQLCCVCCTKTNTSAIARSQQPQPASSGVESGPQLPSDPGSKKHGLASLK
jgi:hypothetical protein